MSKRGAEVYIAGALSNPEENSHNFELARQFREAGYTVFNPRKMALKGLLKLIYKAMH